MPKDIKPNQEDINNVLNQLIEKHNISVLDSTKNCIFITGVSGSGKSTFIRDLLLTKNINHIPIQSDDYRKLHPKINEYIKKYGKDEAYKKTGNYSFNFALELRDKAIENNINVIFEATFSKLETANSLIKPFIEKGYKITVVKLPINVELSIKRNEKRYTEKREQAHTIPRITSREDIEKMATNYKLTLEELSKKGIRIIDKLELTNE